MARNIVILLDGTSNQISNKRTNILRLYGCLRKNEAQLVYYDPGVGTFGAENTWSRQIQKASEVWGMATGYGLDDNVMEAYRFLVENYNNGKATDGERDRIFIFGFSRGAYSARVLAGFIRAVGLIAPRNLNLLRYAYRAYKRIGEQDDEDSFAEVRLYERILAPDRPPIRLLGLFDTVASMIESGPGILPVLRTHAFTENNVCVEAVRHAVALNERRRTFRAQLWPEGQAYWGTPFGGHQAKPQDAKEVWFTGVHGDIGGGYPEDESGLAKLPLIWMIEQTAAMGLDYVTQTVNRIVLGTSPDKPYCEPNAFADPHNSMTSAWPVLEYLPLPPGPNSRRPRFAGLTIARHEPRFVPVNARLHGSVIARAEKIGTLPDHIPAQHRIEGDPGTWG